MKAQGIMKINTNIKKHSTTRCSLIIDDNLLSVLAGSLAGSIGVGVAYPFDSIKTKMQDYASTSDDGKSIGTLEMVKFVLKEEGIGGFYGGVIWVMIGQAFVKGSAFSANNYALNYLTNDPLTASLTELILAAFFAGFVSSFFVNPIERIKILMQADSKNSYKNEIDCAIKVLRADGLAGFVFRGLSATLSREIPGFGLYFVAYSLFKTSLLTVLPSSLPLPLVCGALAGIASWVPVYPIDVSKVIIKHEYITLCTLTVIGR